MSSTNNPFGLPEVTFTVGNTTAPITGAVLVYSVPTQAVLWWNGLVWQRLWSGSIPRFITSGLTDNASSMDSTISWQVGSSSAKSEILPAANTCVLDHKITIKDDSGFGNITITTVGGTIDNRTSVYVGPYGSITLQPDNGNNWMIVAQSFNAGTLASQYVTTVKGINLNTTGDTPLSIILPNLYTRWAVSSIRVLNASATLASGSVFVGLYSGPLQTGTIMAAQQALTSLTSAAANTSGNMLNLTLGSVSNTYFNFATLYFNVGTANGSNVTADIAVHVTALS